MAPLAMYFPWASRRFCCVGEAMKRTGRHRLPVQVSLGAWAVNGFLAFCG